MELPTVHLKALDAPLRQLLVSPAGKVVLSEVLEVFDDLVVSKD